MMAPAPHAAAPAAHPAGGGGHPGGWDGRRGGWGGGWGWDPWGFPPVVEVDPYAVIDPSMMDPSMMDPSMMDPSMMDATSGYEEIVGQVPPGYQTGFMPDYEMGGMYAAGFLPAYEMGAAGPQAGWDPAWDWRARHEEWRRAGWGPEGWHHATGFDLGHLAKDIALAPLDIAAAPFMATAHVVRDVARDVGAHGGPGAPVYGPPGWQGWQPQGYAPGWHDDRWRREHDQRLRHDDHRGFAPPPPQPPPPRY
jgi:hypothetical protein